MIADIVEQSDDLELVASRSGVAALPDLVRDGKVDCVIASLNPRDLPPQVIEAHRAQPSLFVLGVVEVPGDAHAIDMQPLHSQPGALGIDRLRQLIRERAGVHVRIVKNTERTP
jgi:hypothetical protein